MEAREVFKMKTIPLIIAIGILCFSSFHRNIIWDNNIVLWEDGVKKSPAKSRVHASLCSAYLNKELNEKALRHCLESLRLSPYLYTYYNLGIAYYKMTYFDEAINYLKIALQLDPNYAKAHKAIGDVYIEKGLMDKAIEHFQTAIRLNPNYADAHFAIGALYIANGYIEEARREFETALKIDPDHMEARRFLIFITGK